MLQILVAMLNSQQIDGEIEQIHRLLETVHAEQRVSSELMERLTVLRRAWRTDRSSFTSDHVAFLQRARDIEQCVARFIVLLDFLPEIEEAEEASTIIEELNDLRRIVKGCAVEKRMAKEVRGLGERLPALSVANGESVRLERQRRLERSAPTCSRGHAMEVRQNQQSGELFWGCSQFPFCMAPAREMSPRHRAFMDGETAEPGE